MKINVIWLEHNLFFKNVPKGPLLMWQMNIQSIDYGLYDMLRIEQKEIILMIYSFAPSDMNF